MLEKTNRETVIKEANRLGNLFFEGSVFDYSDEELKEEQSKAKKRALICVDEKMVDHEKECGITSPLYQQLTLIRIEIEKL